MKKTKKVKKVYFVDTENVSVYSFLKEESCSNKDKLILLTTVNSTSIKLEYLKLIQETGIEVIFEEVSTGAKNELDFYLITKMVLEMNKLNSEDYEFIIVSNDKGFRTAIDCIKKTMPEINARIYSPMKKKSKKKKASKDNKDALVSKVEVLKEDKGLSTKSSEKNKPKKAEAKKVEVKKAETKKIDSDKLLAKALEEEKKAYESLTDDKKMKSLMKDIPNLTLQQQTYDLIKQAVEKEMKTKNFKPKLKRIFNEYSSADFYQTVSYKSQMLLKSLIAKKQAKECIESTLNSMNNKELQVQTYALIKKCVSNNAGHKKFKKELHVLLDKLEANISLKNKIFGALSMPVKELLSK